MTGWLGFLALAYLCGSIPFGFLIARSRGINIREHGSGNIGATNVGRVLGAKVGRLCLVLDMLKGAVPVTIAGLVMGVWGEFGLTTDAQWWWMAVAASAIVGHVFPVWLKFKGGKGVATGFGALVSVSPVMSIASGGALIVWIISVAATRMVGISSVLAACVLPIAVVCIGIWRGGAMMFWPMLVVSVLLSILVVVRHRSNIMRTLRGTERRIGQRNAD